MILNGLSKLAKEKPIDSITMTEISEVAEVTRMTLYRHFKSKEDIYLYSIDKIFDKIAIELNQKPQLSIYDMLLFRFRTLNQSPYSLFLVENNYMGKVSKIIRKKTFDKFEEPNKYIKDEFTLEFIGGGIDAVTEKWIRSGMTIPYEEMAEKVYHLAMKVGIYINEFLIQTASRIIGRGKIVEGFASLSLVFTLDLAHQFFSSLLKHNDVSVKIKI